ncbi:hypothetical protein Alches_00020 [Alicyclobacillus hesperidum subsp. aegles]|uniref:IS66 family transposase zinc-finger binding domain-containing protein n=1 Tax=Alicyclobacillus hesperidum TaxID=89784 RepID=UPI002229C930|nr:IS66 family transposase zinc-finger binding domain-containing protein [Alicyclobacillus hesperidum]GLF99962.1 hypothetical protein Alches_00020 [Alicyclobacillus hesperidum subsp. aegles]
MSITNGTVTIQQQEYDVLKALEVQNAQLRQHVGYLEEQVRLLRHRLFGASSECRTKVSFDADGVQLSLFNEAEVEVDSSPVDALEEEPEAETEVITYEQKKPQARAREVWLWARPADEVVEYPLPEDEQVCPTCAGKLREMSRDVSRRVKIIPAQMRTVEYVRYVYACRHCETHDTETPVLRAPMPKPVQAKSMATPEAVAYVMTKKFVVGMPLYRKKWQFARHGYPLSR